MALKQILNCYWEEFQATECDFTVIVENHRFQCHRFVLRACSDFFKGLLRSDMTETREGEATLKEMKSGIFHSILLVLYKGSDVLTEENMLMMWQAANQLQIMFLIEACEDFIIKNLSRDNVFDVYNIALLMDSENVLAAVRTTLVKNFTCVSETEMFLFLPYHELLKVVHMAADDPVPVAYKGRYRRSTFDWFDAVVSSVVYWVFGKLSNEQKTVHVQVNTEERKPYLKTLLGAAKINKASRQCLIELMKNDDVMNLKGARNVVVRAIELILCEESEENTNQLSEMSLFRRMQESSALEKLPGKFQNSKSRSFRKMVMGQGIFKD